MGKLSRAFLKFEGGWPYQDNSGCYEPKHIAEDLDRIEILSPLEPAYWILRKEILGRVAMNGLEEQFARGKYEAGMLTLGHFKHLVEILVAFEEPILRKAGFDVHEIW